ncbi:probable E3 ubiquitin-protein ligase XB3 at C-terminar half [Coccomyxa sp. Obi]|nr:probable E3 ubiquitin-protein ligase XB3 at C-terminar half [Coccomyxa sp. Obi]
MGAVQWVRWQLAIAEREHDAQNHRHRGRRREYHFSEQGRMDKGGLLAGIPPEMRQAALNLIDYQLTPVLVDQWRVALVELLFASQNAPPLPETDPELRRALLDSLKTYEEQEARRPVFDQQPRVSVPEPAGRGSGSSGRAEQARRHQAPSVPAHSEEAGPSAPSSIPPEQQPRPSAPPLSSRQEHAEPSAPPLPDSYAQAHAGHGKQKEPPDTECHICMDADVEVEVDSCKHKMCIACAKALCSLSSRAPQCPFCRAAITRIVPIAPAA